MINSTTNQSLSPDEVSRLASLHSLHILDTPPEERFDRITRTVMRVFDVPIVQINLLDVNRQWTKSCQGLVSPEITRDISFCTHILMGEDTLVIPDARLDPRFMNNPLVTAEPYIRFYAGQPLHDRQGYKLGTLCMIDRHPRHLSASDFRVLRDLAVWAETELNSVHLSQALLIQHESEACVTAALDRVEQQYWEAERARSESRAVFDAANEAMILIAPTGSVLSLNRRFAEIFTINPDQIIGHPFDEFHPIIERCFAEPANFFMQISGAASKTDEKFSNILVLRSPVYRELQLFSTPISTTNRELLGHLYVFRDITHEREVDRMKSEFVSLVSHELRTPLTSIKGYVDHLLAGTIGELADEQREFLEIVQSNTSRLMVLVNDLLDLAGIEAGKVEFRCTALDITGLVRDVGRLLWPQIDAKRQKLYLDLPPVLPFVVGDPARITQMITNLLSNAHKYTPPEGRITVSVSAELEHVRIDVQDTGVGLSQEEQAMLFTPFFRAHNRATQEASGTGLGLAITRSLVEMHGGTIAVSSICGQGTTFSITLPIEHSPHTHCNCFSGEEYSCSTSTHAEEKSE